MLTIVGEICLDQPNFLWALLVFHIVSFSVVAWRKRHLHTWTSIFEQVVTWAVLAAGSFQVMSIPAYVEPHLRPQSQWVWYAVTFFGNTAWVVADATDYAARAKRESEKEDRRKKLEQETNQKLREKRSKSGLSPTARIIINIVLSSIYHRLFTLRSLAGAPTMATTGMSGPWKE